MFFCLTLYIVGRTGSGKSSLTLSLLRLILTEGKVYYDGIATDSVNLDALRSHITIIPQVPELLSGTLRQNLDPFSQYDDAVLNDSLRAAGLFSLQSETDEGRIMLDSQIASGGSNLSVGQRQILALARAIVRQSKLLILDEATSAIGVFPRFSSSFTILNGNVVQITRPMRSFKSRFARSWAATLLSSRSRIVCKPSWTRIKS